MSFKAKQFRISENSGSACCFFNNKLAAKFRFSLSQNAIILFVYDVTKISLRKKIKGTYERQMETRLLCHLRIEYAALHNSSPLAALILFVIPIFPRGRQICKGRGMRNFYCTRPPHTHILEKQQEILRIHHSIVLWVQQHIQINTSIIQCSAAAMEPAESKNEECRHSNIAII